MGFFAFSSYSCKTMSLPRNESIPLLGGATWTGVSQKDSEHYTVYIAPPTPPVNHLSRSLLCKFTSRHFPISHIRPVPGLIMIDGRLASGPGSGRASLPDAHAADSWTGTAVPVAGIITVAFATVLRLPTRGFFEFLK